MGYTTTKELVANSDAEIFAFANDVEVTDLPNYMDPDDIDLEEVDGWDGDPLGDEELLETTAMVTRTTAWIGRCSSPKKWESDTRFWAATSSSPNMSGRSRTSGCEPIRAISSACSNSVTNSCTA
jgi:hypothetical protein